MCLGGAAYAILRRFVSDCGRSTDRGKGVCSFPLKACLRVDARIFPLHKLFLLATSHSTPLPSLLSLPSLHTANYYALTRGTLIGTKPITILFPLPERQLPLPTSSPPLSSLLILPTSFLPFFMGSVFFPGSTAGRETPARPATKHSISIAAWSTAKHFRRPRFLAQIDLRSSRRLRDFTLPYLIPQCLSRISLLSLPFAS